MKLSNFFSNPPVLAKYLFILLSAVLVILAFMSFMRIDNGDINGTIRYATYAFMMFIDAAIMLFLAFRIGAGNKQTHQFAMAFLALNAILSIFDQIGAVDVIFILLNVFTLYVLYAYRKDFSDAVG